MTDADLIAPFWVIQGVGFVAAALGVVSFQLARDKTMFILLSASALVWALHFLLLAAPAAAAIHLVTAMRNLGGAWFRFRGVGLAFVLFYILAAGIGYQNPWDLLPLVAVLCGTASVFFLSGMKIRFGFLAGSVLWVIFSVNAGSIPGVLMMSADAISNLRFILRQYRKKTS